jgi:hypothetical protein
MRHATTKTLALALSGLTAFGIVACDRGGNSGSSGSGGGTTIVQTIVQTPGSTSNTAPSVSPISDPKKLCRFFMGKGQLVTTAVDNFWSLVPTKESGKQWSWSDENINKAADHAVSVVNDATSTLSQAVSPEAPSDVSSAIRGFIDAAKKFSDAISSRSDVDELNPLNTNFRNSIEAGNHACGY